MSKLTFKEFQDTRKAVTWGKARYQAEGTDEVSMDVLEYSDGNLFIECYPNKMYGLTIGNLYWFDARLEMLEQLLYDHCYY